MSKSETPLSLGAADHSKSERVYRTLRKQIRSLERPPGSRLRKIELADEFEMSRAPISEAIARLAQEGLVDVYPQSGSFVAPIRPEVIRESMLIRTALEIEALRNVAGSADEAFIAALEENVRQQRAAIEADNMPLLDDLDAALHEIIMQRVDSPRIARWLDICRAQLDRPRFHALPTYGRPHETVAEHQRLVDAIKTRDPDFAAAAMRNHLNMVGRAIERSLQSMEVSGDPSPAPSPGQRARRRRQGSLAPSG